MKLYKFTTVFIPEAGEDGYTVSVPAFPEIATCGDSVEEARFMAQDALELVVLSRLEEGESIPADMKPTRVPKSATVEEMLVSVAHEVSSTPFTPDVKAAFA
ncbi:MAG: type II toxin-antitoxin system HicB family antitoxin [Patescibacteria group bacterium]